LLSGAGCVSSASRSSGRTSGSTSGEQGSHAASSVSQPNSANEMIFWTSCPGVVELTDSQLDMWRDRGAAGFVCQIGHLEGLGGTHAFTPDPEAVLREPKYDLQRAIRDSKIVQRARARGIRLWLGIYLVNYYNPATPLADWFDDSAWSE